MLDAGELELDILMNEFDGPVWCYRRDARIQLPAGQAILPSATGLPVLAPELILLYKTSAIRDKDRLDYLAVAPRLSQATSQWLDAACRLLYGMSCRERFLAGAG